MPDKKLIIAIDGFSSCGKSTLAKMLAKKLDYIYIDSGAMYRAVTLYLMRHNAINVVNGHISLGNHLGQIDISFANVHGHNHTLLNGEDVEHEIRSLEVSNWVSEVATISEIRTKLVEEQRKLGKEKGLVMDGRDIGTVVFPNADLKIFVTASVEVRTWRRLEELKTKKLKYTAEQVKNNLIKRDYIDSNRDDSPLLQAEDAIVIDNSALDRDQQLTQVLDIIKTLKIE